MMLTDAVRQQKHAEHIVSALSCQLRLKGKITEWLSKASMRPFVRDLCIHMPVCRSSGISMFDNMVAVAVSIVIAIVIGKVTPTRTQSCRERGREREREIEIYHVFVWSAVSEAWHLAIYCLTKCDP